MPSPSIAVIDIGSNSIKVLLAARTPDGSLTALMMRTLEARISAGINQASPKLGEQGIARGLAAIQSLLAAAAAYAPPSTVLVATSAVRDAANGAEFCERVRAATGHDIRILSGEEEANFIGRGLLCDPLLSHLQDFNVFDLGGGSLECLAFASRRIERAASLPLGCVRLTEKFVTDPAQAFDPALGGEIAAHVRRELSRAAFSIASPSAIVGTGGTLTTVRKVLAGRADAALEQTDARVTVDQLRDMLGRLGGLPLAERKKAPGLPPERADVFPTALATLVALAEIGGFDAYRHSLYNLRWGIAAEALQKS
jgi:exopolyphosphatase / guanosine-5'-triphosphate,3'-diphosphate pyrophosphatase